jgi:hypothetical protein
MGNWAIEGRQEVDQNWRLGRLTTMDFGHGCAMILLQVHLLCLLSADVHQIEEA